MTLRNLLTILLVLFFLLHISCGNKNHAHERETYHVDTIKRWADTTHLSKEELLQRRVWLKFKQAVLTKDLDSFKKLSFSYLNCPDLLNNRIKYVGDTSIKKECIATDKFILDDFQKVFTKDKNDFYFNEANIRWITVNRKSDNNLNSCYEHKDGITNKIMEVEIVERGCFGGPDECLTTIFTFISNNEDYKFYGMNNIP